MNYMYCYKIRAMYRGFEPYFSNLRTLATKNVPIMTTLVPGRKMKHQQSLIGMKFATSKKMRLFSMSSACWSEK